MNILGWESLASVLVGEVILLRLAYYLNTEFKRSQSHTENFSVWLFYSVSLCSSLKFLFSINHLVNFESLRTFMIALHPPYLGQRTAKILLHISSVCL